jgi:hypothetical protein
MPEKGDDRERALCALDEAVVDAAGYLRDVDPDLDGGHQTAREVLCHLVFWHREYVAICRALLEEREPPLKEGTYAQLNALAKEEFAACSMDDLACSLLAMQESLRFQLSALPDWSIDFPVKQDSRRKSVAERMPAIESHLQSHIRRLRRARRLGEAWVKAYYPDHD